MLKAGLIDSERRTRAFDILDKNASGLSQIVEDVLDVSRIVSGKLRLHLQPVELSSLLAHAIETVRPAADAKGVQIELASSPVPPVAGDPDRLQQVAWNLLSNAVKFTARGGHVRVGIGLVQSQVAITVADNGVGIATEILPHIFERFRQADSRFAREYGGLGLGLAIVRHLVEMHGGTIEALSDGLGKGATFRVVLPVTAVSGTGLSASIPVPRPRLDGLHVLAVDDEDDALTLLTEILETAGATVTTARSAHEALTALSSKQPHLLLSDVGMPGVDGFEFIARVRQLPARESGGIPAIALTAYARPEDRTRALGAGFQMHLAKPVDPDELLAVVHALGHGAGSGR
jgi:CheY-like chemotaxis protein